MITVSENVGLYPHDLLESAAEDSSDRRWWVVYTKSRQEKVFCQQLVGLQVPHYLPLVKKISYCRGRRFSAQVPLFSGYVFMHGEEHERVLNKPTHDIPTASRKTHAPALRRS
jgi:hypothetical protein